MAVANWREEVRWQRLQPMHWRTSSLESAFASHTVVCRRSASMIASMPQQRMPPTRSTTNVCSRGIREACRGIPAIADWLPQIRGGALLVDGSSAQPPIPHAADGRGNGPMRANYAFGQRAPPHGEIFRRCLVPTW